MVIGGCGGAALGLGLQSMWPELVPHPASFAVVGMASFFAAAAKTPVSTLVMVSEMTGGYHLLLPTLWGCAISFMISDEQSIYRAQVESRSRSPAHQGSFVREVLSDVRIRQFLPAGRDVTMLHANESLDSVLDRFDEGTATVLPVVDAENRLLGVVNMDEVFLASHAPELRPLILAILNTLMALPTVLIGLLLYVMLSRRGPAGTLGLLYTPWAMVLGQFILAIPIVAALSAAAVQIGRAHV